MGTRIGIMLAAMAVFGCGGDKPDTDGGSTTATAPAGRDSNPASSQAAAATAPEPAQPSRESKSPADPRAVAQALYKEDPDVGSNRHLPGQTQLKRFKRYIVADFARRARDAGNPEASAQLLIMAAGAESHPADARVAKAIVAQLGTVEALSAALEAILNQPKRVYR